MRAVIQRVKHAQVAVDGQIVGQIAQGLVVLVGAAPTDSDKDLEYIVDKTANLRIFSDAQDKMNLSIKDVGGGILWISQFTLLGDARTGRRPAFTGAMEPVMAKALYERGADLLRQKELPVQTGVFGADMQVTLLNDGPVTILLDSTKIF